MKFIDLFAGIGGFRYGLEKANRYSKYSKKRRQKKPVGKAQLGFSCVWSNEWDKYAAQIYKKHWGECDTRDIRTVDAREIPKHNLICVGFPCQSFSVAGKRLGFEDTRGTLFYDIVRIAKHKRPRHLLLENVKGLLSHDEGKTFQTIIGVLADIGYRVEWMVLNSKDFGVPQNRERVFIIGHLRGECRGQVFPIGETNPKSLKELTKGESQGMRVYNPKGISSTIASEAGGLGAKTGLYAVRQPLRYLNRNQKNIEGDYAFTVDASQTSGIKEGMKIRRLTPTECERLQGFPDGFTEGVSDTQRYKCLGNAVSTPVITEIGKAILKHRKVEL